MECTENKKAEYRYFLRKSGKIVRASMENVTLDVLNQECMWEPNQEWYMSMFVDGDDDFIEIPEEQVNQYINNRIDSSEIEKNLKYPKMTR